MKRWIAAALVLCATNAHAFGVRSTFTRVEGADSYLTTAVTPSGTQSVSTPQAVSSPITSEITGLTGSAVVTVKAVSSLGTSQPSNLATVLVPDPCPVTACDSCCPTCPTCPPCPTCPGTLPSVGKYLQPGLQKTGIYLYPITTSPGALSNYVIKSIASGSLTLTVNIPTAGTWHVWGRFFYPSTDIASNSFYVSIDGGGGRVFGNSTTYQKWHWDRAGGGDLAVSLTAGKHTFKITPREVKTGLEPLLDLVYLTPSTNVPNDTDASILLSQCAPVLP